MTGIVTSKRYPRTRSAIISSCSGGPETIIVVTNYPSDDYRTASRECGADHFFDKASEFHKVREVLLDMR